jgi:hypothetical protein
MEYPYSYAMYYIAKVRAENDDVFTSEYKTVLKSAQKMLAEKYHYSNGKMKHIPMNSYDFILIDFCLSDFITHSEKYRIDKKAVSNCLEDIRQLVK